MTGTFIGLALVFGMGCMTVALSEVAKALIVIAKSIKHLKENQQ